MIAAAAQFPTPRRRPVALGITLALHGLLAGLFLLRQPKPQPVPSAHWIEMIRLAPVGDIAPAPPPAAPARQERPDKVRAPAAALAPPPQPPAAAPAAAAVSELVFPGAVPASTVELARAAAGDVDKEMRKQFPERALLSTRPLTAQQKLEQGIAASVAGPGFFEAARITPVQDQGVGWGRRVDKVQTAFGTYCITHESNHGGDGRDVFKDALKPKMRTCPREK